MNSFGCFRNSGWSGRGVTEGLCQKSPHDDFVLCEIVISLNGRVSNRFTFQDLRLPDFPHGPTYVVSVHHIEVSGYNKKTGQAASALARSTLSCFNCNGQFYKEMLDGVQHDSGRVRV